MASPTRPIIIKRVIEETGHRHHGGAWKVAYADFVTAMMAFFLLLWLLSAASEETLKGLADYFSDAKVQSGPPGGMGGILHGLTPTDGSSPVAVTLAPPVAIDGLGAEPPRSVDLIIATVPDVELLDDATLEAERRRREEESFAAARSALLERLAGNQELARFAANLLVDRTPEGLRIQLVDLEGDSMFPSGSDRMHPHTERLLAVVVQAIADLPNKLSIRGHTDARPFASGARYDNWRLSTDRANATRVAMVAAGLAGGRIAEVIGKGESEHLVPDDPENARNRRISIVLLNTEALAGAP
jgi:chemotaxis protein MotB